MNEKQRMAMVPVRKVQKLSGILAATQVKPAPRIAAIKKWYSFTLVSLTFSSRLLRVVKSRISAGLNGRGVKGESIDVKVKNVPVE